jgi:8-oxo-dGTP pyrophosphatase MutT (NUDIX family)
MSQRARKRAEGPEAPVQYAALPYRVRDDGVELLLITSRDAGRWVPPKGWAAKGEKAYAAAAREALEEAGVKGKIAKQAIGAYSYLKRLPDGAAVGCTVEVFPLEVERFVKRWPEKGQRDIRWFVPGEAARLVDEPELAHLIEAFASALASKMADARSIL